MMGVGAVKKEIEWVALGRKGDCRGERALQAQQHPAISIPFPSPPQTNRARRTSPLRCVGWEAGKGLGRAALIHPPQITDINQHA